jgi:DNA invertase Pin-like site-specific DNA recombinase
MNIGYIRVSTKEQSTARQLDGIKLDLIYEEKISGVIKERPKLQECLIALRKGDTLHVHSMCRLARNLKHLQEIVEELISRGVDIQFHKEGLIFKGDSTNAFSMLILHLLGAVAQFERTNLKERQAEGITQAKLKGTKTGKPFGQVPLDMSKASIAKDLHINGMSKSAIAKHMNLSRPSVLKLINS